MRYNNILYREVREDLTGKMTGNVWDTDVGTSITYQGFQHHLVTTEGGTTAPSLKEPTEQPTYPNWYRAGNGGREKWEENEKELCPRNKGERVSIVTNARQRPRKRNVFMSHGDLDQGSCS